MAIPTTVERNLEQNGVFRTMAIDLSSNINDRSHIIEILRSKLYSDKQLAIIREYSTNAFDSHVEAGIPNTPIKITLPTQLFPEFRIRDYGNGLTPEEIERIYIKYGCSTKRQTNSATGQLGLGCKSAFSYGDNFVVVSYKHGLKTIYNLTINGVCTAFPSEAMASDDMDGIEVVIPIKMDDIDNFQNKAIEFFKYWTIFPEIVGGNVERINKIRTEIKKKPLLSGDTWEIRPGRDEYSYINRGIAVMGNIPYPINWDIVSTKTNIKNNDKDSILYDLMRLNKTVLRFNIGDLDFSASRESLEYTDKTNNAIVKKIRSVLESMFDLYNQKIQSAKSYWEALLTYNMFFSSDDDKVFSGECYKLEKYFEGKLFWNGIPINSGRINNLSRWDQELGYSEDGKWLDSNNNPRLFNHKSIVSGFEYSRGKIKSMLPLSSYSIPANNSIRIIINDLNKKSFTKTIARYIFNKNIGSSNIVNKVYFLNFGKKENKDLFFEKMHFESVPVTYLSEIIEDVKKWNFSNYNPTSSGGSTRVPQTVRSVVPSIIHDKYGYIDNICWKQQTVDLHKTTGFYVKVKDDEVIMLDGRSVKLHSYIVHISAMLKHLNVNIPFLYGITEKTYSSEWFKKATEKGQWTELTSYIINQKDKIIIDDKQELISKSIKYFIDSANLNFKISIDFSNKILPLLKNITGVMYKACSEINSALNKFTDSFRQAIKFLGMDKYITHESKVNFPVLFENVAKEYPMLPLLLNVRCITVGDKYDPIREDLLKCVSDYVNMVDASKKSA